MFTTVPVGSTKRHVRWTVSLFDSTKQLKGIVSPGHSISDLKEIRISGVIVTFAEVKTQ